MEVLVIGDCNSSGLEGRNENVANNLADILTHRNGAPIRIHNLGHTMSTSREGLNRVRAFNGRADVLILNFGLVDAWVTTFPKLYISYFPDNPIKKYARKYLKSIKKKLRYSKVKFNFPIGHVVPPDEYKKNIETIIRTVTSRDPMCRVILWGTAPTLKDLERDQNTRQYDKILKEISKDLQTYFVDTRVLLEPFDYQEIYYDPVHLNVKGQIIIAQAMAEILNVLNIEEKAGREASGI